MPFRTKKNCIAALGLLAFLLAGACTTTTTKHSQDSAAAEVAASGKGDLLTPLETIEGGTVGNLLTGSRDTRFRRPVALAVRGDWIYVLDAGQQLIFQYERSLHRLHTLIDLRGLVTGDPADIYVDNNFTVYIADSFGSRVLHFDSRGHLREVFQNPLNLSRPQVISVDESTGYLYVADTLFDHILVFNNAGQAVTALGGRGDEPGQFLNITAMALGPDGIYIGARVGDHLQVLSRNGDYRYSLPDDKLSFPTAIALDERDRLVFVSDFIDNTIKVFHDRKLVATYGGSGGTPGRFRHITDLWVDDGRLFVADSLNGRIQVLLINPQALNRSGM